MKQMKTQSDYEEAEDLLKIISGSKYEWTENDIEVEKPKKVD